MGKEKLKIGLLYIALHNQLVNKYGVNTVITNKLLFCKLGRDYHLPRSLRPYIINEMVKSNLIDKVSRDSIKILPCDLNIEKEEDRHKLFRILNIK
jgi:hypothetical protein